MKIKPNKKGWLFQTKDINVYVDPEEAVKTTDTRQIVILTSSDPESVEKHKDKFLIDCEGRFEVEDCFIEGLYIDKKKDSLAYYISAEDMRVLFVGSNLNGKGEDSQKNLGSIDILVIRPDNDSDLNLITGLSSEYDPVKVIVLVDKIDPGNIDKVVKFFGMSNDDIQDGLVIKSRELIKGEDGAEPILINNA